MRKRNLCYSSINFVSGRSDFGVSEFGECSWFEELVEQSRASSVWVLWTCCAHNGWLFWKRIVRIRERENEWGVRKMDARAF